MAARNVDYGYAGRWDRVNYGDLQAIVENDLAFRDWTFDFLVEKGRPMLRVRFDAACSVSGEEGEQKGRKWPLSLHMTRSEVASTALKAVLTATEHEAREDFMYRGQPVFGPHVDVDALHALAAGGGVDVRV